MDSIRTREVDLTTAHTNLEIVTNRPLDFLQFWCDGGMQGITVKIGTQSSVAIRLEQVPILPVENPEKVYITNDVRAGRSKLYIFYVSTSKLDIALGGQPITLSEHAVRTGSISKFDRRGEVIFQDDFEGSNLWTPSATGYSTAVLSTAAARSGVRSMKLTTGAVNADGITLQRNISYPTSPSIGMEISHRPATTAFFIASFYIYTGSLRFYFGLRYDSSANELQYATALATWSALATGISLNVNAFHTLKFVGNITNGQYVRAMLNNTPYDMTGLSTSSAASATNAVMLPFLDETTQEAVAKTAYIDDLIITKNEPV